MLFNLQIFHQENTQSAMDGFRELRFFVASFRKQPLAGNWCSGNAEVGARYGCDYCLPAAKLLA